MSIKSDIMNSTKTIIPFGIAIIVTGLFLNSASNGTFGTMVQGIAKKVANGFGDTISSAPTA